MHPYSTDSNERVLVFFLLSVASFLIVSGIGFLIAHWQISLPFWAGPPSWGGVNYALWRFFDARLWRWNFLRNIGVVRVPDLNGNWEGYVLSSYDRHTKQYPVRVRIEQTWSEICVSLTGERSRSSSELAGILTRARPVTLGYVYLNNPEEASPDTMYMHRGTTQLRLGDDPTILEGDYYSGRGRQTYGSIRLVRVGHDAP